MPQRFGAADDLRAILDFYYQTFRDDVAVTAQRDLSQTRVAPLPPVAIKDLDGSDLFSDFAIQDAAGQKVGVIRSSAIGPHLPLIDCVFIGEALFDPADAERAIMGKL